MASILNFLRRPAKPEPSGAALTSLMRDFSIEVMPRTAAKIESFRAILPAGTRVYVAHIDGTPFGDMLGTARRLADEGFAVVPHIPARGIADAAELEARVAAYAEAGICRALVIAGGITTPRGAFSQSMDLLQTGVFDRYGYRDIFVAGHPEGCRDIDRDGGDRNVMAALRAKADFQAQTDARLAITTQFAFEARPIIDWCARLRQNGITLPVHIGIAGPAKLQTMIKYAMACGVGPSLRVLQRRAADLSNLILPFEPTELLLELARHKAAHPDFAVERIHLFPLGGLAATADFAGHAGGRQTAPRQRIRA